MSKGKATKAQLRVLLEVHGGRVERSTAVGDFGQLYIVDIDTGARTQEPVSKATMSVLWREGWITGVGMEDGTLRRERISLTPAGDIELGKHIDHDAS